MKDDAASAIDYCINELGVTPNDIHLFALQKDSAQIEETLVADDKKYVPMDQICRKPDEHVKMHWKAHVKAKYDMLYQWCLTDAEKKQVEGFSKITCHEPTVKEWETMFKQVCKKAMA